MQLYTIICVWYIFSHTLGMAMPSMSWKFILWIQGYSYQPAKVRYNALHVYILIYTCTYVILYRVLGSHRSSMLIVWPFFFLFHVQTTHWDCGISRLASALQSWVGSKVIVMRCLVPTLISLAVASCHVAWTTPSNCGRWTHPHWSKLSKTPLSINDLLKSKPKKCYKPHLHIAFNLD